MKKKLIVAFVLLTLIIGCKKESESKRCTDNKYYCSFIVNGKSICYSLCESSITSENNNGIIKNPITIITGKIESQTNDTLKLFPAIFITLPDSIIKTYNADDINALDFTFSFLNESGSFFFPLNNKNYEGEFFELTINELNIETNIISGNFRGRIYSNNNLEYKFILIENGDFRGTLYRKEK